MNLRENIQEKGPDKLIGLAAVFSSLPKAVWYAGLLIAILLLVGIGIVFHAVWQNIVKAIFYTLAFMTGLGVVNYTVRSLRDTVSAAFDIKKIPLGYRSEKEKFRVQVIKTGREESMLKVDEYMPNAVREAMQTGKNIIYTRNGVRIEDWRSNVHTLPTLETPQLSSPQLTRMSFDECISRIDENSYQVCVGENSTSDNAAIIGFKGMHLKMIGTSQMGKSSLTCLALEGICQTHSAEHVQLALLDLEGLNSNLLKGYPHTRYLAQTDPEEVLKGLEWCAQQMTDRYELGMRGMSKTPLLLIYIEEYLDLRNQLKVRDKKLYNRLVGAITTLTTRGLKARCQLWLCMQTSYSTGAQELSAALANVPYGFSLALKPTAAKAAGFPDNELLTENFKRATPGTSVCYHPNLQGLITNGEYNMKQKLLDYEEQLGEEEIPFLNPMGDGRMFASNSDESGEEDIEKVYEACMQVKESGKDVTVRNVTELTPFKKTKVSELMRELREQGCEIG